MKPIYLACSLLLTTVRPADASVISAEESSRALNIYNRVVDLQSMHRTPHKFSPGALTEQVCFSSIDNSVDRASGYLLAMYQTTALSGMAPDAVQERIALGFVKIDVKLLTIEADDLRDSVNVARGMCPMNSDIENYGKTVVAISDDVKSLIQPIEAKIDALPPP
ncbi:MAG TPA: hypothetical protein VHU23_14295 [Rhizomicrobium sp.]|nr:hypothetical protein [Rhizomicrobium sp.]